MIGVSFLKLYACFGFTMFVEVFLFDLSIILSMFFSKVWSREDYYYYYR